MHVQGDDTDENVWDPYDANNLSYRRVVTAAKEGIDGGIWPSPPDGHAMVQLFVKVDDVPHYLGHNPLQQLFYTGVYGLAVLQVVTGFYLYGLADTGGFFFAAFGWVGPLLGGAQIARFVHHVMTWFWLIFLPVHVYLTVRADVIHNEARITSMISGKRFVRADIDFIDE